MKCKIKYIKNHINKDIKILCKNRTALFFATIIITIVFFYTKIIPHIVKYNNNLETISKEISSTPKGGTVTVFMNETTKLPKAITKEIAGKDINLVLKMNNGIIWTINGMNVKKPKTVSLGVLKNTDNIPIYALKNISEKNPIQLSLDYNDEFGFTAVMTIEFAENNNGLYANLFYYNPETEKLEFTDCGLIENSMANIKFNHASDYALIIDSRPLGSPDKEVTNIFTSSPGNTLIFNDIISYPICVAAILIISCVGTVIIIEFKQWD